MGVKALANEDTLLRTQMFPRLPARAIFVADTNFVSGTRKIFNVSSFARAFIRLLLQHYHLHCHHHHHHHCYYVALLPKHWHDQCTNVLISCSVSDFLSLLRALHELSFKSLLYSVSILRYLKSLILSLLAK